LSTEEGNRSIAMVKYPTDARVERVAFDDEVFGEVQELQDGHRCEGALQGTEHLFGLRTPPKSFLAK
jgi:hypothetical protein